MKYIKVAYVKEGELLDPFWLKAEKVGEFMLSNDGMADGMAMVAVVGVTTSTVQIIREAEENYPEKD